MPRGRPRKSVGLHKQEGTYEPHRHEGYLEQSPGDLVRPRGLSPDEKWLWDTVVKGLPKECFGSIDTVALRQACRLYAKLEKLKDTDSMREWYGYLQTLRQLQSLLSHFGWTPSDRAKLKAPKTETNAEQERFFGVTG